MFIWKGIIRETDVDPDPLKWIERVLAKNSVRVPSNSRNCPYCGGQYSSQFKEWKSEHRAIGWQNERYENCTTCGFWHRIVEEWSHYGGHATELTAAMLREFDISDGEIGFEELATYLKKQYHDIFKLTPRRFEELVAHIFCDLGYETRLTQQTRDGGHDIVLLEREGPGDQIIVECKRYKANNHVSISIARQLLGVQVQMKAKRSIIVTTSKFTKPAKEFSNEISTGSGSFVMDLIDGDRLLEYLNVYDCKMPFSDKFEK